MADRPENPHSFGNWLSDVAVRGLIGMAKTLPYAQRVAFFGWITRRLIAPLAGYTHRAMENLSMIYPDMPVAEQRRIAHAVADNAGRTLIENYSTTDFLDRLAKTTPTGPGVAALEQARAQNRPVILVTGHFGNYEAGRASLVARGYEIGGLYRPMRNPFFNEHYVRTMESFGGPVFPQGRKGTSGFVRHLKNGGMLVLLIDQHQRTGAKLRFMGKNAKTATSAADLALRYNAEVIPFFATRQENGLDFTVALDAPIPHSDGETMTQAFNTLLEGHVRATPEQWFWIHRRWKGALRRHQRKRAAATTGPMS